MHPGPMNEGVEISQRRPRRAVGHRGAGDNGVAVRMALLYLIEAGR